ncbi:MAG: hypothetical protein OXG62_06115 [Nitrospinae bacterium]|nr:hypothetical protein [Nitrospinota bacterium]
MEKLIITNCAADSRKHAGVPKRLQTPDAVAKEVKESTRRAPPSPTSTASR